MSKTLEDITKANPVVERELSDIKREVKKHDDQAYTALLGVDVNFNSKYYDTYGIEFRENVQKIIHRTLTEMSLDYDGRLNTIGRVDDDRMIVQYNTNNILEGFERLASQAKEKIESEIKRLYGSLEIKNEVGTESPLDRSKLTVRVGVAVQKTSEFNVEDLFSNLYTAIEEARKTDIYVKKD